MKTKKARQNNEELSHGYYRCFIVYLCSDYVAFDGYRCRMMTFKPYIFKDLDPKSETFNQWSIRWSETMSLDGYPTYKDALDDLYIKVTNKAIREGLA